MKVERADAQRPDLVSTSSASIPPAVVLRDADRQRVEQHLGAGVEQQRVGRALVGRHVVRLRMDLAEDEVRRVQAVERAHALEQLVGDAVHDLDDSPVHVGDAGRRNW